MEEPEQHISATGARQGAAPHMMRYVLISLLLIVIIFGILLLVWR